MVGFVHILPKMGQNNPAPFRVYTNQTVS